MYIILLLPLFVLSTFAFDLRLIMFSDQGKSINTREKDEKKLKIKSLAKMCLCLERKTTKYVCV